MSWKQSKHPRPRLNARQQLYVTAYLECLQGNLAAELAGYSKKSADDQSKQLQRHAVVRAAIDRGIEEKEREIKDRCVRAMEHSYCQATVDIGDLFDEEGNLLPMAKMPREARRAIASVEVEFEDVAKEDGTVARRPKLAKLKLHDKRASQELFAKYAGKLKERVELESAALEQLVMQADTMFRKAQEKAEP